MNIPAPISASCCIFLLASSLCAANTTVSFSTVIRPILAETCFHCHGHDPSSRKAKLRLDIKSGAFATLDDHKAIVPGKPLESEIYLRMISDDPEEKMPEPDSGKSLTAAQIALVKQ